MSVETELLKRRGRKVTLDPLIYPAEAGRVYVIEKAEPAKRRGVIVDVFLTLQGRVPPRIVRESETRPAPAAPLKEKPIVMASSPTDRILNLAADLRKSDPALTYTESVLKAGERLHDDVIRYQEGFRGDEGEPTSVSADAANRPASYALALEVRRRMAADPRLTVETATELVLASRTAADAPPASTPAISLSAKTGPGLGFDDQCFAYAAAHGVSLRQAIHEVGRQYPHLAAAR